MKTFFNPLAIPESVLQQRLALLDPLSRLTTQKSPLADGGNYVIVESNLAIEQIEAILVTAATPEEIAEIQDQDDAFANLISQYIWARDRLDEIMDLPNPAAVNLQTLVVMAQAIKDEARILQGILKFIKRRFPT